MGTGMWEGGYGLCPCKGAYELGCICCCWNRGMLAPCMA